MVVVEGLTVREPFVERGPLHPPEAVHDVAPGAAHTSIVAIGKPGDPGTGIALRITVIGAVVVEGVVGAGVGAVGGAVGAIAFRTLVARMFPETPVAEVV